MNSIKLTPKRLGFKYILILILFISYYSNTFAQSYDFGVISDEEVNIEKYTEDTDASGVYIFEKGYQYQDKVYQNHVLVNEYHARIKIFDVQKFPKSEISIYLYNNSEKHEELVEIEAITVLNGEVYEVRDENFLRTKENENLTKIQFAFPNLKNGAIVEYRFKTHSPWLTFEDWTFQGELPKIYSEFKALIPVNKVYDRKLTGNLKLSKNEAELVEDCYRPTRVHLKIGCERLTYVMENIPALDETEKHTLSKDNYKSVLKLRIAKYYLTQNWSREYKFESWKKFDSVLRKNPILGEELYTSNYFGKLVPKEILHSGSDIERAKKVYNFVKNRFVWNSEISSWGTEKFRKFYKKREGNAWEINLALINLLNAANIRTHMMILATRENPFPEIEDVNLNQFNYLIAYTEIDGKPYYLDATEKDLPFGILPFRALNQFGRVLDTKGSHWKEIIPYSDNSINTRTMLTLNEDGSLTGLADIFTNGYFSIEKYKLSKTQNEEKYLSDLEKLFNVETSIDSSKVKTELNTEYRFVQRVYLKTISNLSSGNKIFVNPILTLFFDTNPFNSESRKYPVDLGYPREFNYSVIINHPTNMKVLNYPKDAHFSMDNEVKVDLKSEKRENQIALNFTFKINGYYFPLKKYDELRKLFKEYFNIQNNSFIHFEKSTI